MQLLLESKNVAKAYQIAKAAHSGQLDKGGNEYIKHPLAVAEMLTTEDEQITALLHDVVEDTPITLQNLREQGFTERVVKAIDCLTKRDTEALDAYLDRVRNNPLATRVKIADLTHNSDIKRIPTPVEKDFTRVKRYAKEIQFLTDNSITAFSLMS